MKNKKLFNKIIKTNTCWLWTGYTMKNGYGITSLNGKCSTAHRIIYEVLIGKIPKKMVLDHLCKNKICVNPKHMEIVTDRENILRSTGIAAINSKKTECKHGHLFNKENTYITFNTPNGIAKRKCKSCVYTSQSKRLTRARARDSAVSPLVED